MPTRPFEQLRARPILLCLALAASITVPAVAENHQVELSGTSFSPATLDIEVGDSVTWTNMGGFHNVRADDDSFRCANGCDSESPGNGDPSSDAWAFTLHFHRGADIGYYCEIHGTPGNAGMSGILNVTGIFGDGFESGDIAAW